MLVSVGAALIMIVSIAVAQDNLGTSDPARIAAQVVSGIGFLGAGTIIRDGFNIRGLTTAASLWVVAAIGLAAGAGYYMQAGMVTLLSLITLIMLSTVERSLFRGNGQFVLQVTTLDQPRQLSRVAGVLGSIGLDIRNVTLENSGHSKYVELTLTVKKPASLTEAQITEAMLTIEGIQRVEFVK